MLKRKADIFKFFQFVEGFPKVQFSWQISVNGRPIRRNQDAWMSHEWPLSYHDKNGINM